MQVKFIKTQLLNSANYILNNNIGEYITIGSLFSVYGIRFTQDITYLYIYNGEHLFETPLEFFEIVNPTVFSKWKIKIWDNGDISLWPNLFYTESFFEGFAEREIEQRSEFEFLRTHVELQLV